MGEDMGRSPDPRRPWLLLVPSILFAIVAVLASVQGVVDGTAVSWVIAASATTACFVQSLIWWRARRSSGHSREAAKL